MNREQARQEIRRSWRELLPLLTEQATRPANGEASYICPLCGHGRHGDGLTFIPENENYQLHCFGCDFTGDIIELYRKAENRDYNGALSDLADMLHLFIDPYRPTAAQEFGAAMQTPLPPKASQSTAPAPQPAPAALADYTAYYALCEKRHSPESIAYLKGRGISPETWEAYSIGFDPAADPAAAPGALDNSQKLHPAPRIIIPTTTAHYVARSIDPNAPKEYRKLNPNRKLGGGPVGIFNLQALYAQDVQEVFITEGAFDALSVIEAGASALALNSTSNASLLIGALENKRTEATLILCLDNDAAGGKAAQTLREGLRRLNISFITADISGDCKDPNEAIIADRDKFASNIKAALWQAGNHPDNVTYYIDNTMAGEISKFRREVKTGFSNLDAEAGGLYSGLYVIAAISSLGKTTFAHQMADQLAAAGNEVIFFTMEQSRLELVSKSIARTSYKIAPQTAVNSLSIRKGYLPAQVLQAAERYKWEVGDRISIIEGNFNCTVEYIGDYIRNYIRKNTGTAGERPIVFIDYLQVIQPAPDARNQTTKEAVDECITALKRLSRELDITIFLISSVNRANYSTVFSYESLKESGGIEYTADVIWGLQLQCINDSSIFGGNGNNTKERRDRIKEAKDAIPRKIELICLKNRYGKSSYSAFFNYYPANDFFTSCSTAELDFMPDTKGRKR